MMASKSISITVEVYNLLDKYRLKNESFSETIFRLIRSCTSLKELAGSWKRIPDGEQAVDFVEKMVKKIHESTSEDLKIL